MSLSNAISVVSEVIERTRLGDLTWLDIDDDLFVSSAHPDCFVLKPGLLEVWTKPQSQPRRRVFNIEVPEESSLETTDVGRVRELYQLVTNPPPREPRRSSASELSTIGSAGLADESFGALPVTMKLQLLFGPASPYRFVGCDVSGARGAEPSELHQRVMRVDAERLSGEAALFFDSPALTAREIDSATMGVVVDMRGHQVSTGRDSSLV